MEDARRAYPGTHVDPPPSGVGVGGVVETGTGRKVYSGLLNSVTLKLEEKDRMIHGP